MYPYTVRGEGFCRGKEVGEEREEKDRELGGGTRGGRRLEGRYRGERQRRREKEHRVGAEGR